MNTPPLLSTAITVSSSAEPSTVGQTVTFTAMVTAGSAQAVPSGTVVFSIDGVTEPPVTIDDVGGDGLATLSISTLTAGVHRISVTYGGNSADAGSATETPLLQTVNAAVTRGNPAPVDPPTVVSVKRYGIHMQPTVVVITFNEALEPASAQNLSNYQMIGPGGKAIGIRSATYDPATDSISLRPRKRIDLHETYHLTVDGSQAGGVTDAEGTLLDGRSDGAPGSDYSTALTWRNVVLTPAERENMHDQSNLPDKRGHPDKRGQERIAFPWPLNQAH